MIGIIGRGDERGRISGFHRERGHGGNQVRLQLEQFRGRLRDNAREANVLARDVVVFEGLQLHAGHVGAGENLAGGGIDLVEIRRADETLDHRDVRAVRRIQGETFREDLEQAGVVGFGMLEHRGVRLQQDVDGGDRGLLGREDRSSSRPSC